MTDHLNEAQRVAWMRAFRNARRRKTFTQEKLAEESGVDVRTIQRIESEGRGSSASFRAVAAALGTSPEEMLSRSMNTSLVVAIMNEKGGVGRTTLCWNLAGYLASKGKNVLMVQASKCEQLYRIWLDRPSSLPEIECCIAPTAGAMDALLASANAYDAVLIDGTRFRPEMNKAIISHANAILVPLNASIVDVWGTENFLKQIEPIPAKPPILAVLNQADDDMSEVVIAELQCFRDTYKISVANTQITQRDVCTRFAGIFDQEFHIINAGISVHDLPIDREQMAAASELESLWGEVVSLLSCSERKLISEVLSSEPGCGQGLSRGI